MLHVQRLCITLTCASGLRSFLCNLGSLQAQEARYLFYFWAAHHQTDAGNHAVAGQLLATLQSAWQHAAMLTIKGLLSDPLAVFRLVHLSCIMGGPELRPVRTAAASLIKGAALQHKDR